LINGRRGLSRGARWSVGLTVAGFLTVGPAVAQSRTADNAVTEADDAFGSTVGRESIGIYGPGNARGFSPSAAGNLRLDGLYFDPQTPPSLALAIPSTMVDRTALRVGLSAQGYPFSAPSGVVDIHLREPADGNGASILLTGDSYGSAGAELDGSLQLGPPLALAYGIGGDHTEYADGTQAWSHSQGVVVRWRPTPIVEVKPFWTLYNDYDDQAGTFYVPAGAFLPPEPAPRRFDGPSFAVFRSVASNHGVIASVTPSSAWSIRLGLFRSVNDQVSAYQNLLEGETQSGEGERLAISYPRGRNVSLSGELQLSHSIGEGPRVHTFIVSARGRLVDTSYGGAAIFDLGPGTLGQPVEAPEPARTFGRVSHDHVHQTTFGLAYRGRWRGVGEISVSLARTDYLKQTRGGDGSSTSSHATPLLPGATIAITPTSAVTVYAGYSRGLEQSGRAPATATNRGAPLPALLTSQRDAGLRASLSAHLTGVLGVFDLSRPYFGFDPQEFFRQVGVGRNQGIEFSLSGKLTKRLDLAIGGDLLRARVRGDAVAAEKVVVGVPGHLVNANVNWRAPLLRGLSLDAAITLRGAEAGIEDGSVKIPARTKVDLGGRFALRMAGHAATARVQLANVLDARGFGSIGSGIYVVNPGRSVTAYLAVDL
jgi:iron complex outermembrane recepter protein